MSDSEDTPERLPDDPPPRPTTPEFQRDVAKTLADFDWCIAKRAERREQLLRTRNIVHGMTVIETLNDRSAVEYLIATTQTLADLVLDYHDNIVEDLAKRRAELAGIMEEN